MGTKADKIVFPRRPSKYDEDLTYILGIVKKKKAAWCMVPKRLDPHLFANRLFAAIRAHLTAPKGLSFYKKIGYIDKRAVVVVNLKPSRKRRRKSK